MHSIAALILTTKANNNNDSSWIHHPHQLEDYQLLVQCHTGKFIPFYIPYTHTPQIAAASTNKLNNSIILSFTISHLLLEEAGQVCICTSHHQSVTCTTYFP
jgi:hypothetical protein